MVVGLAFAAVSAFWGLGGTFLLDTVGGALESRGREGDPLLLTVVWLSIPLKVVAAVVGVAVVRRWAPPSRYRLVALVAWLAAVVLTVYGAVLTGVGLLVQADVVSASADADTRALRWHTYLWDPWFLVWGLLLLIALRRWRAALSRA